MARAAATHWKALARTLFVSEPWKRYITRILYIENTEGASGRKRLQRSSTEIDMLSLTKKGVQGQDEDFHTRGVDTEAQKYAETKTSQSVVGGAFRRPMSKVWRNHLTPFRYVSIPIVACGIEISYLIGCISPQFFPVFGCTRSGIPLVSDSGRTDSMRS